MLNLKSGAAGKGSQVVGEKGLGDCGFISGIGERVSRQGMPVR